MTSTVQVAGQSRHPTFHGEQVGTLEMNTLQNGDISGVQTINLQPYPPVIAPNPGGELPVGTVVGAYLMWNGTAWVQQVFPGGVLPAGGATDNTLRWNGSAWVTNSAFKATALGDLTVRYINNRPYPVASAFEGEVTTSQFLSLFNVGGSDTTVSLLNPMRMHIHSVWRAVDEFSVDCTYRVQVRIETGSTGPSYHGSWQMRIDLQRIADVIGGPSVSTWVAVTGLAMFEARTADSNLVTTSETPMVIIESEDALNAITRVPMSQAISTPSTTRDYNVILTFKGYGEATSA